MSFFLSFFDLFFFVCLFTKKTKKKKKLTSYVSAACLVTSPLRSSFPTPSSAVRPRDRGTSLRTRTWCALDAESPTTPPRYRRSSPLARPFLPPPPPLLFASDAVVVVAAVSPFEPVGRDTGTAIPDEPLRRSCWIEGGGGGGGGGAASSSSASFAAAALGFGGEGKGCSGGPPPIGDRFGDAVVERRRGSFGGSGQGSGAVCLVLLIGFCSRTRAKAKERTRERKFEERERED